MPATHALRFGFLYVWLASLLASQEPTLAPPFEPGRQVRGIHFDFRRGGRRGFVSLHDRSGSEGGLVLHGRNLETSSASEIGSRHDPGSYRNDYESVGPVHRRHV